MKIKRLVLAFLLLAMPLAPMGWTGASCKNSTVQKTTYNTLATVGTAVNSAYAAWNDQILQGRATFDVSVANAYNKFQKAYGVAVQSASMNVNAIAPQDVVDLANAVFASIKQFTR